MTKSILEFDFEPEELETLSSWHGGLGSMFYAAVSTGSLRPGKNSCSTLNELLVELYQECDTTVDSIQQRMVNEPDDEGLSADLENLEAIMNRVAPLIRS